MARTPPVRTAASKVEVEPQRRRLRPAASIETLRPSRDHSPDGRERVGRSLSGIVSLILHPLQHRFARVAVEARWHSQSLAVGSAGAQVVDAPPATLVDRGEALADAAVTADRHWAVATMIVAAGLAVVVSVIVAPRLRNADLPAYTESNALIQQGAEIYASTCAACHGADLKGAVVQGLGPPPLDGSGHAWLHSDTTLFRMVKFGIASCQPGAQQPQMPSFGKQLDDRSIHAVLAYIKSQWPMDTRVVQNAFNDGESDTAETQEAVLCTAICQPPSPNATSR